MAAIKAKDKLNVGISELLGKAPPPGAPTAADPLVATPLQFDTLFGISAIHTFLTPY